MKKRDREETLADKIAGVLNATPAIFDPEDDDLDNTRAQVVNADPFDEDDTEEIVLSNFRKKNVDLLEDLDEKSLERYKGVKSSRREIYDSSEEESGNTSHSNEESSDVEYESKSDKNILEQDKHDTEESDVEENNEDKCDNSQDDSSEDENDFEDDDDDEESAIKTMTETDLSAQVKKGMCVRNQMQMWENLLEMRIQLQKSLITANKLPQIDNFTEIRRNSSKEFSDQLVKTKNSIAKVLDKLLLLQKLVLEKYPETKKLNNLNNKANENDDEEIPSDTDDEKAEAIEDDEINELPKKKRKLNDFGEEIKELHEKYKSYRNSVIQKWNEKTRIASMKNNSNTPSVVNHIEHILSDKEKLIRRTQLKRSDYVILGQEPVEENNQQESKETRHSQEYNTEIFDDDDFYHQLLRELIEVKSADLTDPVQLSRQWIQLQNLRSKMKRKVDTRATKGRKIRYAVHTKLVNFMAPIDDYLWTEEAKDELFSSLFGKLERIAVV